MGTFPLSVNTAENKKGVNPYTVSDMCLFRRYHVLKTGLGPDSFEITGAPKVHRSVVHDNGVCKSIL